MGILFDLLQRDTEGYPRVTRSQKTSEGEANRLGREI